MTQPSDQIRDQQRDTWDRFSPGWHDWDLTVSSWLGPVGEVMIRQVHLGGASDVLDVATGTGEPGLSAAALVPDGRVTLTDLSERMLAVATANALRRGLRNVDTRCADAASLPFDDASFDAVLCRFGFMFFPDLAAAAQELTRVARPGARISAAVWGRPETNPWATVIMNTIARHVSMPASTRDAPGLFRCAVEGSLGEIFEQAGLREVTETHVTGELTLASPQQYWQFMTAVAAPVVAGLAKADEPLRTTIQAEVLSLAEQHVRHGRLQIGSSAVVVTGTR
jgi:ubiquinone/menaquinone biosynthesis C-methylase UbiE